MHIFLFFLFFIIKILSPEQASWQLAGPTGSSLAPLLLQLSIVLLGLMGESVKRF
jgi:hypothetical protein